MIDGLRRIKLKYGLEGVYIHLQPIFRSLQKDRGFQDEGKLASVEAVDWMVRELFEENRVLRAELLIERNRNNAPT
jgi:hypothetical protein